MADTGDLELEGEDAATSSSSAQPVRKNIAITLKPGTKTHGRAKKTTGRGKKAAKQRASKEMAVQEKAQAHEQGGDMDVDLLPIKMSSSPPEPLHLNQKLRWDHQVNLIGEKVVDPLIHCCEICAMPILIFGRMIPCKHVFCFDCAKKTEKNCPRCSEAVSRIEQSALGTVFICTYGGPKHSASGCHRTYLSQRDLQAHIDYRHLRTHHAPDPRAPSTRDYPLPPKSSPLPQRAPFVSEPPPGVAYHQRGMADSMQHPMQQMHPQPTIMAMAGMSAPQAMTAPPQAMSAPPQAMTAPPAHQAMSAPPAHQVPPPIQTVAAIESYHTIPVMSSSRTNLITVPVQDENNYQRIGGSPQQGAPPGHYPPPTSTTLEYIKSHPPPMSVQPPHMSVQPSIMTQPPPITSSVGPHVGPPPQGVLPPHFSSPQRPYMDELQQPQNLAFGQQGALPNAHHPWPGMSVPGPTLVQGGMALPVQANSRSAQCVAPPSGIVHNRPPNPATMMPAGMLATRPPPAGLPHQSGMPLPTGMLPPQGGMPPVGMMCGPPPQHPPTSSGLGPPSQTRYYQ